MIDRISNCYDSHTHFLATGQIASGLQLQNLKSPEDIEKIAIQPGFYRKDWLTGFGWDQNQWQDKKFPSAEILDRIFPNTPVFLSRIDGHTSWINKVAQQQLRQKGMQINSDILVEQDHIQALSLLPDFTDAQIKEFLKESQKIFNRAGFTHVRDLSMNLKTWASLVQLFEEEKLTVCLEGFVTAKNINSLDEAISEVNEIKKLTCPQLKMVGIKFFVDGSLGSKTAYLSENYLNTDHHGQITWTHAELTEAFSRVWSLGHDVAVHCIGDQCAHIVVQAAREVSSRGILGRLHLEHVEVLRPETIQLMKPLHVTCHMQPCHWLSDHKWLSQTLTPSLQKNIFQWELLRKNKIPFFFSSDSPIEKPSLFENLRALKESSKNGVPELMGDWKNYHSHPDKKWTQSWTELNEFEICQVYFNEVPLF